MKSGPGIKPELLPALPKSIKNRSVHKPKYYAKANYENAPAEGAGPPRVPAYCLQKEKLQGGKAMDNTGGGLHPMSHPGFTFGLLREPSTTDTCDLCLLEIQ